jgi:hypothetical protein
MSDLEWMSLLARPCRPLPTSTAAPGGTGNISLQRDFRRDWGRWSAGERVGAVLTALMAFSQAKAMGSLTRRRGYQ